MNEQLRIAARITLVTTLLFGLGYPMAVTGLARLFFPAQAGGELTRKDERTIGSRLIGQAFPSAAYFHPRPSAAGTGYDALASGGSNLGPTNRLLIERVREDVRKLQAENPGVAIPADLVTASGSGLDPEISPAAAEFQIPRVARERGMSEAQVRNLVREHTDGRQFGILGEPRVNVLELNLALDQARPLRSSGSKR